MWGVPWKNGQVRLRKNIMSGCTISKFCTKKILSLHGTVFSIIKIPKWLILVVQISGKLLNSPMQLLQIKFFFLGILKYILRMVCVLDSYVFFVQAKFRLRSLPW